MCMRRRAAVVLLLTVAMLAGGCGLADVTTSPDTHGYDGPLYLPREAATHPRAGAAGDVVDCETWGAGGFSDESVYNGGATAGTATGALEVAGSEGGFAGVQEGLLVAKEESDRILYVLEVNGVVKQAVILHNGPATEGAGGHGWYVESWANCDYSEMPRSFTDSLGLQIWTDSTGRPAPTTSVQSWTGPEHCSWQSMTFLDLGKATYVRAPLPRLDEHFHHNYQDHAQLPADVIDTGFQRDERHLWLSPDKQRAFVGTVGDVEVWPRAIEPLGCM